MTQPVRRLKPDEPLAYFKWYWRDWRASRSVQRMSYIERGLYRELLDEQWHRGFIPTDIAELADICGCPEDVMADAWRTLSKCFDSPHGTDSTYVVNSRLERERTEQDTRRAKAAISGRLGGVAKQSLANAKQSTYSSSEQSKSTTEVPSSGDDGPKGPRPTGPACEECGSTWGFGGFHKGTCSQAPSKK